MAEGFVRKIFSLTSPFYRQNVDIFYAIFPIVVALVNNSLTLQLCTLLLKL